MSTRGCVAKVEGDGWKGYYNHSDSYPTYLGKELWERWHGEFAGDSHALVEAYKDNIEVTSERPNPLFMEWVYVFGPNALSVFASEGKSLDGPILNGPISEEGGYWNYGHCRYRHRFLGQFPFDGPEPDWEWLEGERKSD